MFSNMLGGDGIIIFGILLIFFGAKKLPELAKGLGSAVREFSKAKDEIEHEFTRPAAPRIEQPEHTEPRVIAGDVRVEPQPVQQAAAPIQQAAASPVAAPEPIVVPAQHVVSTPVEATAAAPVKV